MKKVFLFIYAILFIACSEEEETAKDNTTIKESTGISTVTISNGKISSTKSYSPGETALSFDTESDYQSFKQKLASESDEIKMNLVNNYGVDNLHNLADTADQELEEIGAKATSEDEFRRVYENYKKKYSNFLISNNIDTTDLTLYVPQEDNVETFIANRNGLYVVNNQIKKISLDKVLSNSIKSISEKNILSNIEGVNEIVFRPLSNKKIYFQSYMIGDHVWVKMYAKKHMWYGWKNDPYRNYYFDPHIGLNFVFLTKGRYNQEVTCNGLPRYVFNQNVRNGFNIILGKITNGSPLTGEFHLWCDLTSEHDANGKELTEKIGKNIFPKCLESKSHIVNINLKRQ